MNVGARVVLNDVDDLLFHQIYHDISEDVLAMLIKFDGRSEAPVAFLFEVRNVSSIQPID